MSNWDDTLRKPRPVELTGHEIQMITRLIYNLGSHYRYVLRGHDAELVAGLRMKFQNQIADFWSEYCNSGFEELDEMLDKIDFADMQTVKREVHDGAA